MTAKLYSFHFSIKYGVMPRILSGRNAARNTGRYKISSIGKGRISRVVRTNS